MPIPQIEPDKYAAIVERARELLVGKPLIVQGCRYAANGLPPGTPLHPRGLACLETHLLGTGSPAKWDGSDVLWGISATYMVFAHYDVHAERYVRVWCSFPAPPGEGGIFLDVPEALGAERPAAL